MTVCQTTGKEAKKLVENLARSFNQRGRETEQEKLLVQILSFPTTYRERVKLTFNKDSCICPVWEEEMVKEKITGPGGFIIFDIYKTDYFEDITCMEDEDVQSFQKEKEESPRYHQLLLPTAQCKKEQAIPNKIVYDFTQGKNSHPDKETLFVCTNCGTPMKPKEKE